MLIDPNGLRGWVPYARPFYPETWNGTTASRMENFNNSQYRKYYKDKMKQAGYPDNTVPPYLPPKRYCYLECPPDDNNACHAQLPPPPAGSLTLPYTMSDGKKCRTVCLDGPIFQP